MAVRIGFKRSRKSPIHCIGVPHRSTFGFSPAIHYLSRLLEADNTKCSRNVRIVDEESALAHQPQDPQSPNFLVPSQIPLLTW
jgi:hypothetical protein